MKSSYSTKQFNKDLKSLAKEVQRVSSQAIKNVLRQTTSENAFEMIFDETEAVPFGTTGSTITVVSNSSDEVELEEQMRVVSQQALDALSQEIKEEMKGVLR